MSKTLLSLPVWIAAVFSIAATVVLSAMVFGDKPEPPTQLMDPMPAPDFTVTDHNGKTLTRDDMLGRVWVCDFFLTRCNLICPILGKTMADVAEQVAQDDQLADVRLVSFSVDPEHDTVEQLKQYRTINAGVWDRDNASRRKAIDRHWVHARAEEQDAFWQLVREGFKMDVGPSTNDPTTPVAHGSKLVLIDKQGNIRGYYDGLTDEQIPALLADIRRLVEKAD